MAMETLTLDPVDDPAATNLYTNPGGETAAKWSDFSADWAITREISSTTVPAFRGLYRDKHTFDGSFSGNNLAALPITFPAAGTYVVSAYIWIPANYDGTALDLRAEQYTGSTGEVRTPADLTKRDQWQRFWTTVTVVSGDLAGFFTLYTVGSAPSSAPTGIFYTDAVQVETGSTPTAYFAGDTEGETNASRYRWTGTPGSSTSERVNERTELELHAFDGALAVRKEGPDWGDAEISAYMAEGKVGELPIDFRQANRKVTIPLLIHGDDFETARAQLQQKIGLIQREGGQLRRTFRDGRVLYLDVVNATLGMGGSTLQAQRDIDNEVDLILETLPDWYGPWIHLDPIVETTEAEIVSVLKLNGATATIDGDMRGRCRIRVFDLQGADQLGLLAAFRCRHYDSASTAALEYEAEALDALDTAATATVTGASGGASNNVIAHTNLGTAWTPVLGTNVGGTTYLTHVGSYRVWARLRSPSGDTAQARFVYDVGDLVLPEENDPWTFPAADQFYIADLGEIRLDRAPSGVHRWAGQIQARGETGGEDIQIDKVWFQPLDDWAGRARAGGHFAFGLTDYAARDEFNQSAGSLTGKTLPAGGTWAGAGDSDAFNVSGSGIATRTATSDTSTVGRYALAGTGTLTDTLVSVDVANNNWDAAGGRNQGVLARYTDVNNWVLALVDRVQAIVLKRVAGTITQMTLVEFAANLDDDIFFTVALAIDSAGRWRMFMGPQGHPAEIATGLDADLATGGTLASGRVGMYDERSTANAATRTFDNFAAGAVSIDAAIFANRSADLSTEGLRRLDSSGVAPGPISHPLGALPRVPPSGLEARPVELFVKASRGDLGTLPGSGIDDIAAQVTYRPSWSFVPES